MGWLFALLAGVAGFAATYFTKFNVEVRYSPYIAVAALAGIDALIGGLRAAQEGKFKGNVFVSGFLVNTLLAAFLVYLGEQLGQPLNLAAVVLLGGRIFLNLSIIRREWMERLDSAATARRTQVSTNR
jgi:small basic protein